MNILTKYTKTLLPVAALSLTLGLTSCTGDLDVDPTIDKSTSMEFNRDAVFAKIYANMVLTGQNGPAGDGDIADIDEGTSDFFRQIWNMNELPTDEAICSWGDPGIPELNFGTWDASHGMITGEYYRIYFGITLANSFLTQTADDSDAETVKMRAEARFLRALYYYYAMDFYGNVPFVTALTSENAPQASRAEVFSFIESELTDCVNDMSEPKQGTYGRADKAAAWLLLSRLYLNAQVYTGTPQWAKAAEYAKRVMDSAYKLTPNFKYLFMGDNNSNGAQDEIIFPLLVDGIDTQSYGGAQFLIASTNKDDMGDHGTSESWAGNRARKQLVEIFFPNSEPPTGLDVAGMVTAAGDDRAMFFSLDRNLSVEETSNFTDGFSVGKFTNCYSTGVNPRDSKFVDMDVPFMRAAEAYLTYAEAQTRLGNTGEAKTAIDALKDRAHATASKQGVYSLDDICDEWAREFMFEGRRRMDLIRFGRFGGNSDYVWEWKGGARNGSNFSAQRNVFGLPTKDIVANNNLVQNPGY
ncbi:MAG: RagB/SusD family nutrient uptake outer membrane protein [Bacteroidaceae bacterium]|nr:RagB/SusD family nutrient uptake outer membrane protein [Bacteroidaceae bacterium]